ncbi:hypothetical protein [Ephemeroptericola cinctiostellae]|nr:hypothetical protein [Ephemeroptericola cinctiostellae]
MSLDVLLADDAPREALLAIIDAHPQGTTFIKPLLHYVGLFAPSKSQMSHSRIASLINELTPMFKAGRIERNGMIHIAPLDYWVDALNAVLAARTAGTLTLPLKSHGYLLEIIANRSNAAKAKKEQLAHDNARKGVDRRSEVHNLQVEHTQAQEAKKETNPQIKKVTSDAESRRRIEQIQQKIGKKQSGVFTMTDLAHYLKPATTKERQ